MVPFFTWVHRRGQFIGEVLPAVMLALWGAALLQGGAQIAPYSALNALLVYGHEEQIGQYLTTLGAVSLTAGLVGNSLLRRAGAMLAATSWALIAWTIAFAASIPGIPIAPLTAGLMALTSAFAFIRIGVEKKIETKGNNRWTPA